MSNQKRLLRVFTEDTMISLGLTIVLLGGMMWITSLWNKVEAVEQSTAEQSTDLKEINTRLAHIEGALGISGEVLVIPLRQNH